MYDVFGKFGPIRQIRMYSCVWVFAFVPPSLILVFFSGNGKETRGKAFVVYEDIYDAKNAVDHLSGFNIGGRYIIVLYHNANLPGQGPAGSGSGIA